MWWQKTRKRKPGNLAERQEEEGNKKGVTGVRIVKVGWVVKYR